LGSDVTPHQKRLAPARQTWRRTFTSQRVCMCVCAWRRGCARYRANK